MRVSKEKAAEHRQEILNSAARLFREQGIAATGVDSITEDAGLTHGAVYSQFGSKEAITVESIRLAMKDSKRSWQRMAARRGERTILTAIVETYLSRRHRDAPGQGCLVAALAGDISRQPKNVRDAFTVEFKESLDYLTELAASDDASVGLENTVATFASMAGAMMLARAISDEPLSELILKATAKWITRCAKAKRVPGDLKRAD